jgi:hypothetical protein
LDIASERERMGDDQLMWRAQPMNTGVSEIRRMQYFIELAKPEQSLGSFEATIHRSTLGRGLLMLRRREGSDISYGL